MTQTQWSEAKVCGGRLFTAPVVFSSDSRFFFTFSNTIRVHDSKTGELVRVLGGHTDLVTSVIPSPDPQSFQVRVPPPPFSLRLPNTREFLSQVHSASLDGTVRLHDYSDGSTLSVLEVGAAVRKMQRHPVISTSAIALIGNSLCTVDLTPATTHAGGPAAVGGRVALVTAAADALDFDVGPDGRFAAVVGRNRLSIVDVPGCRVSHRFFTTSPITTVAFHPRGEFVATGEASGRIILWRSWMTPPKTSLVAVASGESVAAPAPAPVRADVRPHQSPTPSLLRPPTPVKGVAATAVAASSPITEEDRRKSLQKLAKQRRLLTHKPAVNFTAVLRKKLEREFKVQMTGLSWSVLHWHAHQVMSMAMFGDGTHLVSGGEESVLVVWNLPTQSKRFLPRVGAPISAVTVSPDATMFALGLLNNTVKIVDALTSQTRHLIRGLTHMHDTADQDVPTGIVADPRAAGRVVLNGVPNSLQFYDVRSDKRPSKFVAELEVAPPNAVRRDVHKGSLLPVARVEHARFVGANGEWLVTVDRRAAESCLKFWLYDERTQEYQLNTRVDSPHAGPVTALACHPTKHLVITASTDSRFKTWSLVRQQSHRSHLPAQTWHCRSVGYYRGMPVHCAAFSQDGSVLALGSGSVISLWDPLVSSLQFALSHPAPDASDVRRVMFLSGCPLLVALTPDAILVWNLVTRSIWWSYRASANLLCCDTASPLFAVTVVARKQGKAHPSPGTHFLIVFDGRNPKPQATLRLISPAVAVSFLPPPVGSSRSTLVYLNEHNELIAVEPREVETKGKEKELEAMAVDGIPQPQPTEFESAFEGVVRSNWTQQANELPPPVEGPVGSFTDLLAGPTHTLPALEKLLPKMFERILAKKNPTELQPSTTRDVQMGGTTPEQQPDVATEEERHEEEEEEGTEQVDGAWLTKESGEVLFALNRGAFSGIEKFLTKSSSETKTPKKQPSSSAKRK